MKILKSRVAQTVLSGLILSTGICASSAFAGYNNYIITIDNASSQNFNLVANGQRMTNCTGGSRIPSCNQGFTAPGSDSGATNGYLAPNGTTVYQGAAVPGKQETLLITGFNGAAFEIWGGGFTGLPNGPNNYNYSWHGELWGCPPMDVGVAIPAGANTFNPNCSTATDFGGGWSDGLTNGVNSSYSNTTSPICLRYDSFQMDGGDCVMYLDILIPKNFPAQLRSTPSMSPP